MKIPHKHAELIKAWADGAEIQSRLVVVNDTNEGHVWVDTPNPAWDFEKIYRIKPEPRPDEVKYCNIYRANVGGFQDSLRTAKRMGRDLSVGIVEFTFDGETGLLKSVEIVK